MDKKSTVKEKPKQQPQNYVPRKDYGDLTEDEAMEANRQWKERNNWHESNQLRSR